MRQVVLDTETTGLEVSDNHRVIEIGAVEIVNRKLTGQHFHYYLNPEREVDQGAFDVHGIATDFLKDKPLFRSISEELLKFLNNDALVIHNAPFDLAFLNNEFLLAGIDIENLEKRHEIVDTLSLAREKHPGQKNNLDALCKRYEVDNSSRTLHGALLDSEILADVYLMMTGGQVKMNIDQDVTDLDDQHLESSMSKDTKKERQPTKIVYATEEEMIAHEKYLQEINDTAGICIWNESFK